MRVILNGIEDADLQDVFNVVRELKNQPGPGCIYVLQSGATYYAKETKRGYSIFKDSPAREEEKVVQP